MVKITGTECKQRNVGGNSEVKSLEFCDHDPFNERGDQNRKQKADVSKVHYWKMWDLEINSALSRRAK